MDERPKLVELNLADIGSNQELHAALARSLDFPDYYGKNWDAFWDVMSDLVSMPRRLRLVGWSSFAARLPEEARQLRECLDDMGRLSPSWASVVEYA